MRFSKKGTIVTLVLVFSSIFLLLLSGLLGFILLQLKQTTKKIAWQEALEIAEAGINYYKWCLNNEIEKNCQREKEFLDIMGNPIGKFSLKIFATTTCGEIIERTIVSEGYSYKAPEIKRKIKVFYGKTSVAKYVYLSDESVWAGSAEEIRGVFHCNGGIRMDSENQSLVTSAKKEWVCTYSFGCSPCPTEAGCRIEGQNCICPGIFTTSGNANEDLFEFPVPPFDFERITVDLAKIKSLTQVFPQKYYWPPATTLDPQGKGYHLKFLDDGSFEIWIITELLPSFAYSREEGWHYDYFIIKKEYQYGKAIFINQECPLIFLEDNLWLEGKVKGKVTVVSANLIEPTKDTNLILPSNITYTKLDGSDGLTAIGEKNILISPDSPNEMELRGIFIAQKGHFGRNFYWQNLREKLEVYGSVISKGRAVTTWLASISRPISGYVKGEYYFDSNLLYSPPPLTPFVSEEFKIVSWEELE